MRARTALVVGGTGPTGPYIVAGLEARGFDVTIMHTGAHEVDDVAHLPHIHTDVRSAEALTEALSGRTFDIAVVTYGRLRSLAEVLVGKIGQFVSIGGVPAYRGWFDATVFDPEGLPVPAREDAPTSTEAEDGKSYRIARTEQIVMELHPSAAHLRYPYMYGPRQLVVREWCVVRRILDGRRRIIVADGGLTLHSFAYVENVAHAVLCAVDHPDEAAGHIFNVADEETLSIAQVIQLCGAELGTDLELISMPTALAVPARPMLMAQSPTHRVLDVEKLRTRVGYHDVVPPRDAVRRTARWLVEHPFAPDGPEERVLEDPFDYRAEDALIDSWHRALAQVRPPQYEHPPGYGLHYGGPGATYVRPDTRI